MGEALGTSAALCIVCSSPYYEGGYPLRPSVPPYAVVAYGPRWTNFPRRWSQCGPSVRRAGLPAPLPGSRRAGQSCVANRATSRRDAGCATSMQYRVDPRPTFVFPVFQSSLSACVLSSSQVPAVTLGHAMDTCLLVHVHTRSSTNLVRSPPRSCMSGGRASPSDVFILVLGVGTLKLHPWWLRGDTEATATIPCH